MSKAPQDFLNSLRQAVKAARSKTKSAKPRPARHVPAWAAPALIGLALTLGISGGLVAADALTPTGERTLLTVLLWMVMLHLRGVLAKQLTDHPDLLTLALLPAGNELVFRRQFFSGLRRLLWVVPAVVGIAWFVQLGTTRPGYSVIGVGIAGAGLGAWLLALAVVLVPWRHASQVYVALSGLALVGWVGGSFLSDGLVSRLLAWINRHGDLLVGILPPGWLLGPAHRWISGEAQGTDWLWLLPAMMALLLVPFVSRRMRRGYEFREAVLLNYAAEAPEAFDEEARAALQEALERPPGSGVTEVCDRILSREFLAPDQPFKAGWIERLVWRWWTPRQRLVAEWEDGPLPDWTNAWKLGTLTSLVTVILAGGMWLAGYGGSPWLWWLWFLGGGLTVLVLLIPPALSALNGDRLSISSPTDHTHVSPFGLYPISSVETLTMRWKSVVVRCLAALPALVIFGAVTALCHGHSAFRGADLAAKACFAVCASVPPLFIYRVAHNTNDARGWRFRSLVVFGWHLLNICLVGGLGLLGFLLASGWWFLTAALVCGILLERGYRHMVNRQWFDLMRQGD